MKVYLAGPMRGYALHNFPGFAIATARLRELGHEVFSPAEYDERHGFDPRLSVEEQHFSMRSALRKDLDWIIDNAEAVIMLEGWRHSKGATAEACTACAIGIPVYELETFLMGDYTEVQL